MLLKLTPGLYLEFGFPYLCYEKRCRDIQNIKKELLSQRVVLTKKGSTLDIMAFALAQDRSLGIFPLVANKTMTAAVTLMTAGGGDPKDFNSVRLALFRVFNACWAASSAETFVETIYFFLLFLLSMSPQLSL